MKFLAQVSDLFSHVNIELLTVVGALVAQWLRLERRLTKLETRMEDLFKINRVGRRKDFEEFQE